ncbi:MAG: hypothetical protein LBE36_10310 [Flavobacteriaceae bacterium]|nr:hypothetical protein [Flavobacteriaceae bacterium]
MKSNFIYIILFFIIFGIHFVLFRAFVKCCEPVFIRYYLFLMILFFLVITIMSIFKKLYPNYLGFAFMGLVMLKLALMFLVMNKLKLSQVPNYKIHFILPYLCLLMLVTLYSINLIQKNEKNQ